MLKDILLYTTAPSIILGGLGEGGREQILKIIFLKKAQTYLNVIHATFCRWDEPVLRGVNHAQLIIQ